jgi:hypothetical protein
MPSGGELQQLGRCGRGGRDRSRRIPFGDDKGWQGCQQEAQYDQDMKWQFGFHGSLRSLQERIQKQKAGREKRPASRDNGLLQLIDPAKRLKWCPTRFPLPGKELSCGGAAMVQTIFII